MNPYDTYPNTGNPALNYATHIRDWIVLLSDVGAELVNLEPDEWTESTVDYLTRETEIDLTEPDLRHARDHDPCGEWLERCLDVHATIEARRDDLRVTAVTALVTAGGPRCEITYNGNHNGLVHVQCWSSGEYAEVVADALLMADALGFLWQSAEDAIAARW